MQLGKVLAVLATTKACLFFWKLSHHCLYFRLTKSYLKVLFVMLQVQGREGMRVTIDKLPTVKNLKDFRGSVVTMVQTIHWQL